MNTPLPRTHPPHPHLAHPGAVVSVRTRSGAAIAPDHLDQIERLDDVIFAALDGDPRALEQSADLYRQTATQTPGELLDESREKYLHRAESIVQQYVAAPDEHIGRTFAALEILSLLAE